MLSQNGGAELAGFLEQVRQAALGYPDSQEYFPWRDRAFFRQLNGSNFLFIKEQADHLEILLRLPPGQRPPLLELPFVSLDKSLGYKGWLNFKVSNEAELAPVLACLPTSYALAKPVRSVAEALPGESPQLLDFLAQLSQAAHSYGEVEEFFPYGDRAFRKIKGQIFLHASERGDHLYVSVRLPFGEREYALEQPFVEVPKYIGHKGWVAVRVSSQEELDTLRPWLDLSYSLNNPTRTARARRTS